MHCALRRSRVQFAGLALAGIAAARADAGTFTQDDAPAQDMRAPCLAYDARPANAGHAVETKPDCAPRKDYLAPAWQILGFQVLLNRFDNAFLGPGYGVSFNSIGKNLHSSWVKDRDPFEVNQIGHPYQGSIYYGLARANGLNFWESMGYAFAGSAVWEIAGETTRPSRNDQITTSFGGSFLGEALYRMANLVLEQGYGLSPAWREAVAAAISPSLGFKRYVYPGSADIFASHDPAIYARLQLGASMTSHHTTGPSQAPDRNEAAADFALDYGLPGKDGYTYRRPFDYFNFQLRLSNVQGIESLNTRGLLFGAPYESGRDVRGIAGLYGSYDYLAPQLFKVASSAFSLGSNLQWRLADAIALLGHASAGIGYTSAGTFKATSSRQYNYGFAPQAMLSLRLILGDKLAAEVNVRKYFNGGLTAPETGGTDRVTRADASLTYRLYRKHAVALKYISSRRDFDYPGVLARKQRRDSVGVYYVYQPAHGFGAVQW
jgi:Domain of unknown function (DUF3943)